MKANKKNVHARVKAATLQPPCVSDAGPRTLLYKKGTRDLADVHECDRWVAIRDGLCAGVHPCHIDLPPGVRPQDESKGAKSSDQREWWSFKLSSKMRVVVALTDTTVSVESLSASDHPKRYNCKRRP
jgi:hypothetical protein